VGAPTASVGGSPPQAPSGWLGLLGGVGRDRRARRAAVLVGVLGFLVILLGSTVTAYVGQRGDIAALRDKVASQEQDVAKLEAERELWRDPAYVEQQARQRLKFVKPGERSYTVLDPEPDAGNRDPLAAIADTDESLPWYQGVWESSRTADAPGARR
jgi:cell division protein FtsB